MFNLTLENFNGKNEDLLYLGRLQLNRMLKFSKVDSVNHNSLLNKHKDFYNVKIEYFFKGAVPTISVKAFSSHTPEMILYTTNNQNAIKKIIRICN